MILMLEGRGIFEKGYRTLMGRGIGDLGIGHDLDGLLSLWIGIHQQL
jgi:hypothetical protein